jgi:hypothetical protein
VEFVLVSVSYLLRRFMNYDVCCTTGEARARSDHLEMLFWTGEPNIKRTFIEVQLLFSVDLDIEGGGSTGFAAFVTQLRSHFNGASKR